MKRLALTIHGQVQGVFFRKQTQEIAISLGLVGWVKNSADGAVEALAEGEDASLKKLLEFCQSGPERAKVLKVDEKWSDVADTNFSEFEILY